MIGTRLAHYEITSIGRAGWVSLSGDRPEAETQRGHRSSPAPFADAAERLSRFRREAQTLASLNHPNIPQIYGIEESGNKRCIAMGLVEGGNPSQARIKRGAAGKRRSQMRGPWRSGVRDRPGRLIYKG